MGRLTFHKTHNFAIILRPYSNDTIFIYIIYKTIPRQQKHFNPEDKHRTSAAILGNFRTAALNSAKSQSI